MTESSPSSADDIEFALGAAKNGTALGESLRLQVARVTGQARGYREDEVISQN